MHDLYKAVMFSPVGLEQAANKSVELIRQVKMDKADFIAVTGSSGLTVGTLVSVKLRIPLLNVRKYSESSHGNLVEFPSTKNRKSTYIILDDFISSGDSVLHVMKNIRLNAESKGFSPLGIFLYWGGDFGVGEINKVPVFKIYRESYGDVEETTCRRCGAVCLRMFDIISCRKCGTEL